MRFPLIAVDGELKTSGGISFNLVYGEIDKKIAAGEAPLSEGGE